MVKRSVQVAGVAMTPFGRHLDRSLGDLARDVSTRAVADAELEPSEVDLVVVANAMAGRLQGQESVRGQVALAETELKGTPIVNVDNACAGSSSALQVASWALAAGRARSVLVMGVEKLYHPDKEETFKALAGASDKPNYPAGRSMFMDFYAERARAYLDHFGVPLSDIASVAVKNRANGAVNEVAQFRERVTLEDVLNSRVVVDPLTLLMCSPISDGASAVVLTAPDLAPRNKPGIRVRGLGLSSGSVVGPEYDTIARTAHEAFGEAGITAKDIDLVEVHDATAIAEIDAIEALGLYARGEGAAASAAGETAIAGAIPVNTSGGLLSRGHPVSATGLAQIIEIVTQLRGAAGIRQVSDPAIGVAENHGGLVGNDVAAVAITVLERTA